MKLVESCCTEAVAKPPCSASSAHGTTLADYPVWEEGEERWEQPMAQEAVVEEPPSEEQPEQLVVEEEDSECSEDSDNSDHSEDFEHSDYSDYSVHSHSLVRHKRYRTAHWLGCCDHIYYNKA